MKKLFLLSILSVSILFSREEKSILHFDINRTIIACDPGKGKSHEDILNLALAKKYKAKWDDSLTEEISFYDYVYKKLFPGKRSDKSLRDKRRGFIKDFLKKLKEHPLKKEVEEAYDKAKKKLDENTSIILPSFLNFLDYLEKSEENYVVLLRTFGFDLINVVNELSKNQSFHPKIGFFDDDILRLGDERFFSPESMYQVFKRGTTFAIRDSYYYWNNHEEHPNYGKIFPLDLKDPCTLSVFFDDNVELEKDSPTNIINPIDIDTSKNLAVHDLVELKNIHRVDTLEAILDDDYFIKLYLDSKEKSLRQKRVQFAQKQKEGSNELTLCNNK